MMHQNRVLRAATIVFIRAVVAATEAGHANTADNMGPSTQVNRLLNTPARSHTPRVCVLIMALACGFCTHLFGVFAPAAMSAEVSDTGQRASEVTSTPKSNTPRTPERKPDETPKPPVHRKLESAPLNVGKTAEAPTNSRLEDFLNRLEMAESDGRQFAKNPRSSALGPFQFIASTWISVMRSEFPELSGGKTRAQLLAMRTEPETARKAARAYVRKLSAALQSAGLKDTPVNLRIAFHFGPSTAVRMLKAQGNTPVARLISRNALRANPYLRGMTLAELKSRAKRRLSLEQSGGALGLPGANRAGRTTRQRPRVKVRCNLKRASCRRWLALQRRKLRARRAGR